MTTQPLHLLLVEDDEVDAEYLLRALRQHGPSVTVTVAHNGREALAVLRSDHGSVGRSQPWLIVTDINMPLMNGLELLQALRQDPILRRSVVYVLSSSELETDKNAAYAYQAAGYLHKGKLTQALPAFLALLHCYQAIVEFPAPVCSRSE